MKSKIIHYNESGLESGISYAPAQGEQMLCHQGNMHRFRIHSLHHDQPERNPDPQKDIK
jgi:hypothetical protein